MPPERWSGFSGEAVWNTLNLSGCEAERALLVGDSADDMKAGRRARIGFRVGLLQHSTFSGRQLHRAGAHLVLNRFGDLQDLLPGER
jgi:phosphoglycolate phosphatase-like HAD superfamily hydrolase